MKVTIHYCVQNILEFDLHKKNFPITPQSLRIYCYFEEFKSVSSKVMIGDPNYDFKVIIFKIKI